MSVVSSLERIVRWGASKGLQLKLLPGANEEALTAAEAKLGGPLPADYRALLLHADGQEDNPDFPWMPGCDRLAPLASVLQQAHEERELAKEYPSPDEDDHDPKLRGGRYRTARLPIAGSRFWDGDVTFIDFDPGSQGQAGQLITMVTECDFVVLGASLADALARYADALEAGTLVWENGAVSSVEAYDGHSASMFASLPVA